LKCRKGILKSLRILIITHAPLTAELGASQVAVNLGEALKELGHEVTVWSPQPLPPETRWWQTLRQMRARVNAYIDSQEAFDLIDSPATFITKRMCRSAIVVARSTQPDILYLASDFVLPSPWSLKQFVRLPFHYGYTLFHLLLVVQGWQRASYILCLGTREFQWMKKWFPFWRDKVLRYVNTLSRADQEALAKVRSQRQPPASDRLRFLWIGRWTAHKGTDTLLAFIKKWSEQRPQDCFTIAGCDADAERQCPESLIQRGTIRILPYFKREELFPLLAAHDIGLFTSKVEGWGLSLNEMLESGMPVFATAAGAVADLQAYFNTLQPFPPSSQFSSTLPPMTLFDEYYKTFNWRQIACHYLQSVIPQFVIEEAEGCYQ
jgi:glycosyltransferase involved in cell wall biosynthesis